jgi:hypothetical protein
LSVKYPDVAEIVARYAAIQHSRDFDLMKRLPSIGDNRYAIRIVLRSLGAAAAKLCANISETRSFFIFPPGG